MSKKVLIVEDHEEGLKMLLSNLRVEGISAMAAKNVEEALSLLKKEPFALILSDLKLPGRSGLELLKEARQHFPHIAFIIMTAYGSVASSVQALQLGAQDFVEKPLDIDQLIRKIHHLLQFSSPEKTLDFSNIPNLPPLIGESPEIQNLRRNLEKIASSSLVHRILILGESGTGKELVARRLHTLSSRRSSLFVPVNCSAIPQELWESEFFGSMKGAYTGATTDREGYFQLAHRGTLFLDEIGEIPLHLQSKLLRVIETGEILRLGASHSEKVDVQIISATNVNLGEHVDQGHFRSDLFYRLNGIPIHLIPLKERLSDIPLLVEHFLKEHPSKKYRISESALFQLQQHSWPGNIRELFNVIQRTLTFMPPEESLIEAGSLQWATPPPPPPLQSPPSSLSDTLKNVREQAIFQAESQHIQKVLEEYHWNRSKAAKHLDVSYKTLLEKIKSYRLTPPTKE
jgi:DNA-binding NtrC family response regulator